MSAANCRSFCEVEVWRSSRSSRSLTSFHLCGKCSAFGFCHSALHEHSEPVKTAGLSI